MTTLVAPDRESDHSEAERPTTRGRDPADTARREPDPRSFDPTQGRKIGADPYDDPTQGRKIGSGPYDDPTQGRTNGEHPHDDPNRAFAAAGGHEGAVLFPTLGLFVTTCLDPRVDPAHFLGLQLSDAIVARNVGGRVTPEVINDIAYISQITENVLPDGPLFEVAVIHHTQCGAGALADDTFRRRYAERIGADEADLRDHAVLDPAATVTSDVERLRSAAAIPERVAVSGHVDDVVAGLAQTIVRARCAQT